MIRPASEQVRPSTSSAPYTRTILASALVARLLATALLFRRYPIDQLIHTPSEIYAIAISLATHQGFSSPFFTPSGPTAFLAPGYPLLVAAAFALFGVHSSSVLVVIAIQISLSLVTVWLVMRLALRQFGVTAANVAGCICALSAPSVVAPFQLWETSLSALLLIAFLAVAPHLRAPKQWAAAGAGTAAAALVNPALLPTLFAVAICQAWRRRSVLWIASLAFLLVYAPWPLRNAVRMHAFIPLRSNFGYELWMGNHAGGDGDFDQHLDPEDNLAARAQFVSMGELPYMRMKSHLAVAWIRTHQGDFLRLTLIRIARFWTAATQGMIVAGALLCLAALAGLAVLWRNRPDLRFYAIPLVLYPLPYYITHPDGRFRTVIDPLLAILAAYAVSALLARMRTRQQADPVIQSAQTHAT
jgi:hypothetical protein